MVESASDDLAVVHRIVAGDEGALNAVYARYADPLYAFIHHRMDGRREDVEEVWQDTWLAAFRSFPTFTGNSRLFTWLCGIARHKIADFLRRSQRVDAIRVDEPADDPAQLLDPGPLTEEIVESQATRLRVVTAMAALPDDYQSALVARYADGRSVEDVARILGRTYKATESLLSRARSAFRAAFSAPDSPGESVGGTR